MVLPTRNTVIAQDVPFLQWANGLMRGRSSAQSGFSGWVGWLVEHERDEELDEAARKAGCKGVEIRHQGRDGRGDALKRYWSFGQEILLYPITTGPVAGTIVRACKPEHLGAMAEAGLGVRWPKEEMDGSRGKSRFALRAIVHPLAEVGYLRPLQLVATSLMSERLLCALVAHMEACSQADKIKGREVFPAELAWPLGPGDETSFGSGQSTRVVPMVCMHPRKVEASYVEGHWRSDAVYAALEEQWPAVQAWARSYCQATADRGQGAADGRASADAHYGAGGLYMPGADDIEECITKTDEPELLEKYRDRALDLRDARAITAQEQMRLSAMIEEKLARSLDTVQF
jgi:hypothetical protein